ncbi:MAG TPA: hypothetical protein VGC98_02890 [Thermoleophilaceae bacterium]
MRATTAACEEREPCFAAARFDDAALPGAELPDCVELGALEDVELAPPPPPAVDDDG